MPLAINAIREHFPALNQTLADGQLPVFFDNPAGTPVPQRVTDAVVHYYSQLHANSGGSYGTSAQTDAMVQSTREWDADFLNAPSAYEVAVGANIPTLNFALSRAIGKPLKPGDEIVLTRMDHDANVEPWRR